MTCQETRCPACREQRIVRALTLGYAVVWRCVGCGLWQTVPPPSEADGRERFAGDPAYFAEAYAQPKNAGGTDSPRRHWTCFKPWGRGGDCDSSMSEATSATWSLRRATGGTRPVVWMDRPRRLPLAKNSWD